MTQNVINGAFEQIATMKDGVELLLAFDSLATKLSIRRCVEKKTSDMFSMFCSRCEGIKHHFESNRLSPPLKYGEPQFSGAASWAKGLLNSVASDWEVLQSSTVHMISKDDSHFESARGIQCHLYRPEGVHQQTVPRLGCTAKGCRYKRNAKKLEQPLMKRVISSQRPRCSVAHRGAGKSRGGSEGEAQHGVWSCDRQAGEVADEICRYAGEQF